MVDVTVRDQSFDMHVPRKRILRVINSIITAHNLSNVKLPKIFGLSPSTIDGYRCGIKKPRFKTLAFIKNRYKISLAWIVNGLSGRFTDDRLAESFPLTGARSTETAVTTDGGFHLADELVFISPDGRRGQQWRAGARWYDRNSGFPVRLTDNEE